MQIIFYAGKTSDNATGGSFAYCKLVENTFKKLTDNVELVIDPNEQGSVFGKLKTRIIMPYLRIRGLLTQGEVDQLVTAHFWQGVVGALQRKRRFNKHTHFFFAPYFQEREASIQKKSLIGSYILRWAEASALARCDTVCVLSEHSRTELINIFNVEAHKIKIIPPFVKEPKLKNSGKIFQHNQFCIVRRMEARMGIDYLLKTIDANKDKLIETEALFIFVGTGSKLEQYRTMAKELGLEHIVKFNGFVTENEKQKIYQTSKAAILPTLQLEGFGISTLEALSYGLPVIGTNVGATPELLSKVDQNLLVDAHDIIGMGGQILRICQMNTSQLDELRDRALTVSKQYSSKQFSLKLKQIITL